jgi:hypothetical protein
MFVLRIVIAVVSTTAALLMIKFNSIPAALRINAFVGLANQTIFILIGVLGISNIASSLSTSKLFGVILGIGLIVWGTMK